MSLPRLRFTVRMLMVMVAIVALSAFLYETHRRNSAGHLDRNSGRFLVLVKTFRGSSAKSQADALAFELRHKHGLPSYVMASSDIRRLKPSAKRRNLSPGPAWEEVVVLIGDCQTLAESQAILNRVRRIQSKSITSLAGKLRPFRTTNPYLPATVTTK